MTETINYGRLMHKAMRQLIVDVLEQVARDGLPGNHHFFITFDTTHPGVDMADSLRQRYPQEMTIVMQDWFENLAVAPDRFTVTLNFGNQPEPIVVPFEAIRTFVDPSVEFGLKFDAQEEDDEEEGDEPEGAVEAISGDKSGDKSGEHQDAEVVSLDQFRKH
jgi:uncharacterized protein